MSQFNSMDGGHVAEGDVVRYLDGEMTVAERAQIAGHFIACAVCTASLDLMRTRRDRLAGFISELSVPAMTAARRAASLAAVERSARQHIHGSERANRPAALRAAAVGGILVASAFATSPVRAWVLDLWDSVSEPVANTADGRSQPEGDPITLNGASIGFVPTGESFLLEIHSEQAVGSLILGLSTGASVNARAIGGEETVEVVRLPSGMRIENSPTATGDYAVSVPATLTEVRVRVGQLPDRIFRMDSLSTFFEVIEIGSRSEGADQVPGL